MRVRVAPGAVRNRIDGIFDDGEGGAFLKAAVTAPPEGGKANAALIRLLAKEWRLPKSSLVVIAGASGKRKTISIEGDTRELMNRFTAWVAKRESID